MACFLVPAGETVVVKAVEKAVEKRGRTQGSASRRRDLRSSSERLQDR